MSEENENYLKAEPCGAVLSVKAMDTDEEGKAKLPTISIQAYNGGEIIQWWGRTVVDLAGMEVADNVAILANHNPETPIGHAPASAISISESGIQLEGGIISGDKEDPDTRRILRMAENGFPWQASIGAPIMARDIIAEGETVEVNGQDFVGPITVIRASKLKEISVLTMGADETTSSKISAKNLNLSTQNLKGENMGLENHGDSNESQDQKIEASAPVEINASQVEVETLRAELAEEKRIRGIEATAGDHAEIKSKAIKDGWSVDQVKASVYEIEKIRAERSAPVFNIGGKTEDADGSIEAGFALSCGVKEDTLKAGFSEDAIADAQSVKIQSFSQLAQLKLAQAGKFNPTHNKEEMLRLAFSTVGLSSILSNTANKILLERYMETASVSDLLSVERMVADFKDVSMEYLSMDLTLKEIGETGEAQHGTVSDTAQTARVKSFARQFVVDRQMLINDDLGAFQVVFSGYGKGARVAEERNFFETFTAGTPGATLTGAGSALSIDSLTDAFTALGDATDENGDPIDLTGALLVVPPALATFGRQLQSSMYVTDVTAQDGGTPSSNPHMGQFETVVAPYLNNGNVAGGSATRWYLMANPASTASFVKLHLTGAPAPVIRQRELAIGSFGVGTDAVFDFGASAVTALNNGVVRADGA